MEYNKVWRQIETQQKFLAERMISFLKQLGNDWEKVEKAWFQEKAGGIMLVVGDSESRGLGGIFVGTFTEHDPLFLPTHLLPQEIVPGLRARVAIDHPMGEPCEVLEYFWRSDRVIVELDEPDKEGRTIISVWRQRTVAIRKSEESDEEL